MVIRRPYLIIGLSLLLNRAQSWSGEVHKLNFDVASEFVSHQGYSFITSQVGDISLALAESAILADSPDALEKYPSSDDYHFSHTPHESFEGFVMDRDCGFRGSGRCLVTGLSDSTS